MIESRKTKFVLEQFWTVKKRAINIECMSIEYAVSAEYSKYFWEIIDILRKHAM